MTSLRWMVLLAACVLSVAQPAAAAGKLELNKGDHICIIGNTLAERMQHYGWLETYIHARFPSHELVFRNLGYSGDEITLRLRSASFGSPDEWLAGEAKPPHKGAAPVRENRFELTNTKADVVFAFFGYNESYAGAAGLDKFKKDLENMVKGMLAKKYNGKSGPQIVLFSPIAFENHNSPDLPDGKAQNENLKLYSDAMAEVAKACDVVFVDLFTHTQKAYAAGQGPLTINGVHINEAGDKFIGQTATSLLFGPLAAAPAAQSLEKLHAAVNDKNWFWFHRYRTTDGFSNFGGRGGLKFVDGQTNYEVLQRESEILDVMVSNRDKRVWAAAQGGDVKVDDSNTQAYLEVKTNKPGKGPDGKHVFLSGQDAIEKMKVAANMKVTLFADEAMFPELVNPQQMAFDTKGRLWVTAWPTYPHWRPKDPMNDKLLILEDTNGDGKADKCITFAGDLNSPTGFEFYNGGVLVAAGPEIFFLKDTNGDDKYDVKERYVLGIDTADTHHASNSFVLDPGGGLYFQEGTFHHSQVESPWGPPSRVANGAVFRFEPRTHKFEVYVSHGFANPHGHTFNRWGVDVIIDGTGAVPYYGPSLSVHHDWPNKNNGGAPTIYKQRTRPCPGAEVLTSKHFPDEMQGNFLVPNVIGFQGVLHYKLESKGAGIVGTEIEPVVVSSDPNFRPCDIEIGPDGAIWFTDWQNPIIGHMQHNLRDPSRDKQHGRVYRVTYEGRPLSTPAKIAGEPVEKVVALLASPEDRVRYRAKIELSSRNTKEVIAAVKKWALSLDAAGKDYEHHMMEVLWVHQWHNVVDEGLLKRMLRSPEPEARAAATRVLSHWRDRVADPLGLLLVQVKDDSMRVRQEAVRSCSFFQTSKAAEVALESLNKEQDGVLKYTLDQTMRTLGKYKN